MSDVSTTDSEVIKTSVYAAALDYASHRMVVIPVHGVNADNQCTCGTVNCKNAGKHPARAKWQQTQLMTQEQIEDTWVTRYPEWNVGLLTGKPSGFWALDVDPKNGGDVALAQLEAQFGKLPRTRTHRTGSGGVHYLFRMPADFEPTNSSGRLPTGVDVRGTGGQIVAPPSVSGIGPYGIEDDADIADAPEWLLDLIRPRQGAVTLETVVVEDLPMYADLDPMTQRRVQKYAAAALENEARRYEDAPAGEGNNQLFRSAARMFEIVQSPWNLATGDEALTRLERARQMRQLKRPGGGQSEDEFGKTVMSARSKVIGQGRPMPEDQYKDSPFAHPSSASASAGGAEAETNPFYSPFDAVNPSADAWAATADTTGQGGLATLAGHPPAVTEPARPERRWHVEDISDVLSGQRKAVLPELASRTDGVKLLYRGKEHCIAGEPESGKTWFALLCVVGILRDGGCVTYVDFEDDAMTVVGRLLDLGVPVDVLRPEAGRFRYVRPEEPPTAADVPELVTFGDRYADLLVYDGWTEGASLIGKSIMEQDDIALWRQAVVKPALSLGVATLTTDHVVKDKDARGRYSIGAQHKLAGLTGVMFIAEVTETWGRGSKGKSKILITKDRNGGLRPHGIRDGKANMTHIGDLVGDAESGEMISLVLYPPMAEPDDTPEPWIDDLPENQRKIVLVLKDHGDADGHSATNIRSMVKERFGEMGKSSFFTALTTLKEKDLVRNGATRDRWALASQVEGREPDEVELTTVFDRTEDDEG